jgi:general secretion pathway protein M
MEQIEALKQWYRSLPSREQIMVTGTTVFVLITLFYVMVWEPLHIGLRDQQAQIKSQTETLAWMQQTAREVKALQSTGGAVKIRDVNKPVTLVIEQSLAVAGLKQSVKKIESSGSDGARVTLDDASFNQVLIWLNTLATYNNIQVISANIERSEKDGRADVRLSFQRP